MKRLHLALSALAGFTCMLALALYLLFSSKLSGAEFTTFVLAFAVLAVAVSIAQEIQEISIAGNVLKLKEAKDEALKAIASLERSRTEAHRALLKLSLDQSGFFSSTAPLDPRIPEFLRLIELASEYGCTDEVKPEILQGLDVLLSAQLRMIAWRNKKFVFNGLPDPFDVAEMAFDAQGINEAIQSRSPQPELDTYRAEIKIALEGYSKLFSLKQSISPGSASTG